MVLPARKRTRLPGWDYSVPGGYFVTICTKGKVCLFWNVGANCVRPPKEVLSFYGQVAKAELERWNTLYTGVKVDKYVIMPNHIHAIIRIEADKSGRTQFAPTLSRMVKQFKGAITKKIGVSVWQKSFHDHIIRNEADYRRIWEYIDTNPVKWEEDCFYVAEK